MRRFAVLALVLSVAACADIDRTLYNVSEAVAPQDRVTGARQINLASRQTQIAQSNKRGDLFVQQNYLDKGKPVNGKVDAAAYARLENIFGRVHAVSHLSAEPWQVILLPDETFNAFVMGGTQMFFFKGALDTAKSDDEIAAIIGHEIAHVAANHVYEQQSYTMAAQLQGSKSASRGSFQTAFTYNNEEEADRIGVLYAALAGYDPHAASALWQRIYAKQGDFSAMLISHPVNSRRAADTRRLADAYKRYYMPGKVNPDHAAILRQVFGGAQDTAQTAGQGGGVMAVLGTAATVLASKEAAKAQEAAQKQNLQFIAYVNQHLGVDKLTVVDKSTLRAFMSYRGKTPVRNLNLVAIAGEDAARAHNPNVIKPGSTLVVDFVFARTDLSQSDPSGIRFQVGHAEMAP